MANKAVRLYCEVCNWRTIVSSIADAGLVEVKRSSVPTGVPKRDPATGKVTTPDPIKVKSKYKCPKCGRLVTPVAVEDVQATQNDKMRQEELERRRSEQAAMADMADAAKQEALRRAIEHEKNRSNGR
jgi:ribosomal protein L44E